MAEGVIEAAGAGMGCGAAAGGTQVRRRWSIALPGAAILLAGLVLAAQPVPAAQDPTRPPAGLSTPPPGAAQGVEAPLRLSGVFLADKLSFAIIDGREVRAGDRLGESRVTRIDEAGVWLRTPAGTRLLRLLPEIKKPPAQP